MFNCCSADVQLRDFFLYRWIRRDFGGKSSLACAVPTERRINKKKTKRVGMPCTATWSGGNATVQLGEAVLESPALIQYGDTAIGLPSSVAGQAGDG